MGWVRTSGRRESGRCARRRPWLAQSSHAACGRGRGGCRMRSASRGSRQISLVPLSWHTATLPSRLDPVFFSQHACSPYNTRWDHRATEQPRTNQQKIQTGSVGGERTSGRRERGRSARGYAGRAHVTRAACGNGRRDAKCAQRLWVRDKIERHLWRGTEASFLLAATPHFFPQQALSHITRNGIP